MAGSDAKNAVTKFVGEVAAVIERLQSLAVVVKDRASACGAQLASHQTSSSPDSDANSAAVKKLRMISRALNGRLKDTMDALTELKRIADDALVLTREDDAGEGGDRALESLQARFAEAVENAEDAGSLTDRIPDVPGDDTTASMDVDRTSAKTASTSTDPDAIDPTLERKLVAAGADLKSLADVVRRLREHERDVDARATLASEVRRLAANSSTPGIEPGTAPCEPTYSEDNFAYGSTPFATFWKVIEECPLLAAAMARMASCQQKEYGIFMHQRGFQVWGSSSGWLLFYAAFACKVAGVGYELLGCHVDFANELLYSMLNKLGKPPVFIKGDVLEIGDVECMPEPPVVWLTSQCWDQSLRTRVNDKLTKECVAGSLVVDYGEGVGLGGCADTWEKVSSTTAAVSWNPTQTFHVYRRKGVRTEADLSRWK